MENQNQEKLRDPASNGSNENIENETATNSASQQEKHVQDSIPNDSKSSPEMDSDQRALEQDEQEETRRNFENSVGHRASDELHRALSQFDPESKEVQECEHWTFRDPELDLHGHF